ncbi:MAG: 1,4-dihydroxy-2-naphthoate polyprenyltransferase [Spirochaetales bacterium]|nr:1,4-dihydroxy-2-naphthoate polyprenyltransferase [Spirochaetales bacterium]
MKIKSFFRLVEIQTKIASLFPFVFATVFSLYRYGHLNRMNLGLMFVSLLFFDMTTTAINNYMDYKKAVDREYRDHHNIIGIDSIPEYTVRITIFLMLGIAVAAGILLTLQAGWIVLILGIISFFVGIFYTFGPIPISRMPLGEILSGFMMGFVIVYLSVYIHFPHMAVLSIQEGQLFLRLDLWETFSIALVSVPFVLVISNLMLANNICDLEQDIKNDRFLLPYYVGVKNALLIFRFSYYGAYLFIIVSVVLQILPWFSLLSLLSFPVIQKHIRLFEAKQIKSETFVLSVKNLTILSGAYILALVPGLFIFLT